jgi:hypothetical protein
LQKIEATYDYVDADGQLVYQVVRYEPKTFKQRRPDGKGGWIWSLNGVQRTLYNAAEVAKAEAVLVVEGEKDVESARKKGIVATCNPGGAGKWRDEYSEILRGKHVTIIPDNDEPGRKHAEAVATSLHLKAASVKICNLPKPLKDLSEWFLSDEALLDLIEKAAPWSPEAPAVDPGFRDLFHSYEELQNAPPLTFAIRDFLQKDGITLIGGPSGHSKTFIALSMVKALLSGNALWNHFPVVEKAARVLYLVPESALGPFVHRLKLFGLLDYCAPNDERLLIRTLSKGPTPRLDDPRILAAAKGSHVFLDTAVRFAESRDENGAMDNQPFAEDLFALLAAGAHALVGLHHSPKTFVKETTMTLENVLRGSGDIGAMVATCFGVKQIDRDRNIVHVENVKPRDFTPPLPFQLIGRPYIDETGDFQMHKRPGECGSLADEQPDLNRSNSAKHDTRTAHLALVKEWDEKEPGLRASDLVERFDAIGAKVKEATIRGYRHAIRKGSVG